MFAQNLSGFFALFLKALYENVRFPVILSSFFIGFFIHISMEKLGVHRLFCKYRCSLAG
jgi:hypothetical protein